MSRTRHFVLVLCTTLLLTTIAAASVAYADEPAVATEMETAAAAQPGESAVSDLPSMVPDWAKLELFGIAIWQVVAAFVLILLGLVLKKVLDFAFEKKIIPLLQKTPFKFDHLIATAASKPLGYLVLLGGFALAFGLLPLPEKPDVEGFVFGALKVLLAIDIVWFLFRTVDVLVGYLTRLAGRTESTLDDQLVPLIRKALKATIAVLAFVSVVELLGGNVASLLAGLGIGGLAVALALQDTLSNVFGSIFIFVDRPFGVGDWIKLEGVEGVVEEIGFRSTRIRTFPATLVSIPNKTVANATIDNQSRMPKRRVLQTVGVTYETTPSQMEQAVAAIRDILEHDEGVDKEFIVVRFTEFADSSLNILVYYFTKDVSFADHTATKERINLAIMRAIHKLGLSIAFPTRSVYLEGTAKDLAQHLRQNPPANQPDAKQ
jgi:MscS family membrane protein